MSRMYLHEDGCIEDHPKVSSVTVTTSATPIPATPLEGRNGLLIHNSSAAVVYFCNADGTGSFPLDPSDHIFFNTRDEYPIVYMKTSSSTATIDIIEWR